MIRSDQKKKNSESAASKENAGRNSDSESEEGSQYNIFGSKRMDIPKELRENLGISQDSIKNDDPIIPKAKKQRTESILKKNSLLMMPGKKKKKVSMFFQSNEDEEEEQIAK